VGILFYKKRIGKRLLGNNFKNSPVGYSASREVIKGTGKQKRGCRRAAGVPGFVRSSDPRVAGGGGN